MYQRIIDMYKEEEKGLTVQTQATFQLKRLVTTVNSKMDFEDDDKDDKFSKARPSLFRS